MHFATLCALALSGLALADNKPCTITPFTDVDCGGDPGSAVNYGFEEICIDITNHLSFRIDNCASEVVAGAFGDCSLPQEALDAVQPGCTTPDQTKVTGGSIHGITIYEAAGGPSMKKRWVA